MEVVLNLPDKVYGQAERLAGLLNQDLPRVLAETIENALSPLGASAARLQPVAELSDRDLLKLADLRMETAQGERMGLLLERQQAGELDETERRELTALTQVYHENLVRKAQALSEAVRRGLREPIAK
ncbi:MAG: hypothetical protein JST85_27740 [Acidobacteria bacterium]|nr:hypothetical protein [Acidobacteriota bacterium]